MRAVVICLLVCPFPSNETIRRIWCHTRWARSMRTCGGGRLAYTTCVEPWVSISLPVSGTMQAQKEIVQGNMGCGSGGCYSDSVSQLESSKKESDLRPDRIAKLSKGLVRNLQQSAPPYATCIDGANLESPFRKSKHVEPSDQNHTTIHPSLPIDFSRFAGAYGWLHNRRPLVERSAPLYCRCSRVKLIRCDTARAPQDHESSPPGRRPTRCCLPSASIMASVCMSDTRLFIKSCGQSRSWMTGGCSNFRPMRCRACDEARIRG